MAVNLWTDQSRAGNISVFQGMIYIHNSEIKSHGNLKSSTCYVDSRWVLKISGFGLNKFKYVPPTEYQVRDHAYYRGEKITTPYIISNPPIFLA
jgi:hypothetical protein